MELNNLILLYLSLNTKLKNFDFIKIIECVKQLNRLSKQPCPVALVKIYTTRVHVRPWRFPIVSSIRKSKYFSISVDSTPDEGHIDQLTIVFWFMEGPNPVERFLKFLPNQGHKAQEMFDGIMQVLEECNLDIKNCRGQSYDNASAMSGKYNGLQSKIIAENSLATYAAHSLNLVGKAAAECCSFTI